ncbi:hypothetical protein DIU31_030640 [Mucilaginibacter rubeus]|uniref:Uncharacterized protein n=1 Tax=Mucilaginibacter rubeus TaxID=2027860 RepID=A0AAE6JPQ5_9SPHI|nr:hypothetical protein DIU31_030640 [Mucilaginibacter rubeus]QEM20875.1 hypothetical protein DIU38_030245 [Mucilaginibacter gossypii]
MSKSIKIALSILLFLCLFRMQYGYYEFVRFSAFVGFVFLAYQANQGGYNKSIFIYGTLALLFQPFFKIPLGRQIWNIVDIAVGVGLIVSIFIKKDNRQL